MARIQNLNVAGMSVEDIRQLDTRTVKRPGIETGIKPVGIGKQ